MSGAFENGEYRNLFAEIGISGRDIDKRVRETFDTIFFGSDEDRFYHPVGDSMGYITDTGNHDVRTEGMSYGMMICVQMDRRDIFDRLWLWTKTYMYLDSGANAGFFCWSNQTDGTKNSTGPAPDGEEYFAMALIFAANRWDGGREECEYMREARTLLHTMLHKGDDGKEGRAMWDPENHLIRFITEVDFTDPSYHLPHFYQLFSLFANEEDREFWRHAAQASRDFLVCASHPETGLSAEYTEYDGTPYSGQIKAFAGHDLYYSDSYRTIANIALDWAWFGEDPRQVQIASNLQRFFCETVRKTPFGKYRIDGTLIDGAAMHPVAMTAVNAQASLASDSSFARECVERFWNTPLRKGDRRYYDNCLYMFAMLALSGRYRIWI